MKSVRVPIELKGNTIVLSRREYGMYCILKESLGKLVLNETLKKELDMTVDHLRMTKKSLSAKIESSYKIKSLYGIGYLMEKENALGIS